MSYIVMFLFWDLVLILSGHPKCQYSTFFIKLQKFDRAIFQI